MKKCSKCSTYSDNFNSSSSVCRDCILLSKRTKEGLISRIYLDQRNSSKQRGHKYPEYSKLELIDWVFLQKNFETLYNKWVESGFDTLYRPSIDRLDESIGYHLSNIQLVTWRENKLSYSEYRRSNVILKLGKKVKGVHIQTKDIVIFNSLGEAEKYTKSHRSSISKVCKGIGKSAGGYKWEFI